MKLWNSRVTGVVDRGELATYKACFKYEVVSKVNSASCASLLPRSLWSIRRHDAAETYFRCYQPQSCLKGTKSVTRGVHGLVGRRGFIITWKRMSRARFWRFYMRDDESLEKLLVQLSVSLLSSAFRNSLRNWKSHSSRLAVACRWTTRGFIGCHHCVNVPVGHVMRRKNESIWLQSIAGDATRSYAAIISWNAIVTAQRCV